MRSSIQDCLKQVLSPAKKAAPGGAPTTVPVTTGQASELHFAALLSAATAVAASSSQPLDHSLAGKSPLAQVEAVIESWMAWMNIAQPFASGVWPAWAMDGGGALPPGPITPAAILSALQGLAATNPTFSAVVTALQGAMAVVPPPPHP